MTKVDSAGELDFETAEEAHHAARLISHALELLPDGGNEILQDMPSISLSPELLELVIAKLNGDELSDKEDAELLIPMISALIPQAKTTDSVQSTALAPAEPELIESAPETQHTDSARLDDEETKRKNRCEEDKELIDRMISGDEVAASDFVARYDRLLWSIVNEVYNSIADSNIVSEEDLYQEAFEHMFMITKRWDGSRGIPFHTYFTMYFRPYLLGKYADMRHQVRIPNDTRIKMNRVDAINQHRRFTPGMPLLGDEELMDLFGTKNPKIIQNYYRALRLTKYIGSLDKGFSPGGQDTSLGDEYPEGLFGAQHVWSDPREITEDASEIFEHRALTELLERIADTLSDREAGVINLFYGLVDDEPKTLDEIAKIYGISSERAKLIYSKVMSKLRHPSRSDYLKSFIIDDGVGLPQKERHEPKDDCDDLAS